MVITIKKLHVAIAVVVVALIAPATALAFDVFDDVPDDAFYAEPVSWAAANQITTGKTVTTFDPLGFVTRGESVTFLKRYEDNVVAPRIPAFASDSSFAAQQFNSSTPTDLGLSASVTIPVDHTGVIVVGFSAETACWGGNIIQDFCTLDLLIDGASIQSSDATDFAFDGGDDGHEGTDSWEGHAMIRVSSELTAGTYVVTANAASRNGTTNLRIDEMVLTAEVKLTS